jgi:hypothetical protein
MSDNAYASIRSQLLSAEPDQLGLSVAGPTWGVLMETSYFAGIATLVALSDGTATLLFSNGGGVAAKHQHKSVQLAARRFVSAAAEHLATASATNRYPHPGIGRVCFYLLTTVGVRTLEAGEEVLERGKHELSDLFHDGHRVITQLRHIAESS